MIPFEFAVMGVPVSVQTRNRRRLRDYKKRVRARAERYWPSNDPPEDQELRLIITYFYDSAPLDVDNIVKPIQDALIGLVYYDDDQITEVNARKRNLNGSFRVRDVSPAVADGFVRGRGFVHILVEEPD